ncbi:MAG: carbamate kinase [Acidimicrobiales bacterium]|nr:carbamate kinase [Acidimicrobiales bacterium]
MTRPLLVVGLGGNALAGLRDAPLEAGATPLDHVEEAARALAALAGTHRLVITHGNGPQVGRLAEEHPESGLDELDAATAGELGYELERALRNHLAPGAEVLVALTQVLVDRDDEAFAHPTKPIGARYDEATATALAAAHGWQIQQEAGGFRRVVASPAPQRIVELAPLRLLVAAGVTVICGGGGGIPVSTAADGRWRGVDAVIDKDLTTARLAVDLDAAALLLLTDVAAVQQRFGTADAVPISTLRAGEAEQLAATLPAGSMGAKLRGALRFARATGRTAGIGRLADAAAILDGTAGTAVTS